MRKTNIGHWTSDIRYRTSYIVRRMLLIIIFMTSSLLFASEDDFWTNLFFDDFIAVGSAVVENPWTSILIGVGVAGITAFTMDNEVYFADTIKEKNDIKESVFDIANYMGDGVYVLAANSLLFLGGEKEKKTAQKVIEAVAVSGAISYVGKVITGRNRPSITDNPYQYNMFSFSNMSMPSGHTTVAFAWATIIGDNYDIGYITYPIATLCGLARVYKDKHWLSDTIIGALIGTVVAKSINNDQTSDVKIGYDGKKVLLTAKF